VKKPEHTMLFMGFFTQISWSSHVSKEQQVECGDSGMAQAMPERKTPIIFCHRPIRRRSIGAMADRHRRAPAVAKAIAMAGQADKKDRL